MRKRDRESAKAVTTAYTNRDRMYSLHLAVQVRMAAGTSLLGASNYTPPEPLC